VNAISAATERAAQKATKESEIQPGSFDNPFDPGTEADFVAVN
jgi:hypothetical protein